MTPFNTVGILFFTLLTRWLYINNYMIEVNQAANNPANLLPKAIEKITIESGQ